ncbi:MAG: acetyl ornithine aminotransferase family protein [Gemmatimonadetes bacterium]|nr:acetyl ornithine aminotransferase family protein [Gemmatimonadota bacterium]
MSAKSAKGAGKKAAGAKGNGTNESGKNPRDYPRIRSALPGPRGLAIIARDEAWTSSCYIKEYPLVIERGEGVMVEDADGNRFLDFMAGIAVSTTGYGHPVVVKAVQDAAAKFLHICGSDFYYESMAVLAERLAKLAPGSSPKKVFLSNSGTEAVEGAIKLARYATRRTAIIAFKGAFHGRTTGAISLTSSKARQHAGFGPLLPDVHHVPYGYCFRCEYGRTFPSCNLFCVDAIERDLLSRHLDPRDVAAIFVEPILGEGGYVVPPAGWLAALRALCDKHGILLVFDEIQSGVGRTGKMFAAEHDDVEPDIVLVAKGLASGMPIGAMIAKASVSTWKSGAHGSTFGGNPVCCAAALATLDLVEGGLMKNAVAMGTRMMDGLRAIAARHENVGDVRGRGLMIGVDFVRDRATREPHPDLSSAVELAAFRRGLLVLSCGKSTIRIAPPLVIDAQDVDVGLGLFEEAIAEAEASA